MARRNISENQLDYFDQFFHPTDFETLFGHNPSYLSAETFSPLEYRLTKSQLRQEQLQQFARYHQLQPTNQYLRITISEIETHLQIIDALLGLEPEPELFDVESVSGQVAILKGIALHGIDSLCTAMIQHHFGDSVVSTLPHLTKNKLAQYIQATANPYLDFGDNPTPKQIELIIKHAGLKYLDQIAPEIYGKTQIPHLDITSADIDDLVMHPLYNTLDYFFRSWSILAYQLNQPFYSAQAWQTQRERQFLSTLDGVTYWAEIDSLSSRLAADSKQKHHQRLVGEFKSSELDNQLTEPVLRQLDLMTQIVAHTQDDRILYNRQSVSASATESMLPNDHPVSLLRPEPTIGYINPTQQPNHTTMLLRTLNPKLRQIDSWLITPPIMDTEDGCERLNFLSWFSYAERILHPQIQQQLNQIKYHIRINNLNLS